jgi:hypothetical protein
VDTRLARRTFSSMLFAGVLPSLSAAPRLRVAGFRCDVTPDIGEPLIWVTPASQIVDPLWAKGVVLEDSAGRIVLCAIDWCGVGGATDLLFRQAIAAAARTDVSRVALQAVHQHTAPYVEGDGYAILSRTPSPPLMMSSAFIRRVAERLAQSVTESVSRLEEFDQVGTGEARVDRVASARRLFDDGKLVTRFSTGGSKPELAALPEGPIDPQLRTVTLARRGKPLVRLHYYATHPQTFCCDGRVSGDFVSAAREDFEKEEKVPQVYFTGCSGDVTAGKYNDSSSAARQALAERLGAALRGSAAATRFEPVNSLKWRSAELHLSPKPEPVPAAGSAASVPAGQDLYRTAITRAFGLRRRPLPASLLAVGNVRIVHLPGEPMLVFQEYARTIASSRFVAVAGYGDISPGYLCTDRAFAEGGYEPGASNATVGTEAKVKKLIRELLDTE